MLSTVDTVAGPKAYANFMERARAQQAAMTLALTSPGNDEKPLLVRLAAGESRIAAFGEGEYATAGVYAVRPVILREAEEARRDGIDALRKFLARLLDRGGCCIADLSCRRITRTGQSGAHGFAHCIRDGRGAAKAHLGLGRMNVDIDFFEWRVRNDPQSASDFSDLAGAYLQRCRESGDVADAWRSGTKPPTRKEGLPELDIDSGDQRCTRSS